MKLNSPKSLLRNQLFQIYSNITKILRVFLILKLELKLIIFHLKTSSLFLTTLLAITYTINLLTITTNNLNILQNIKLIKIFNFPKKLKLCNPLQKHKLFANWILNKNRYPNSINKPNQISTFSYLNQPIHSN